MWESRRAISKGGGKRWETCFWFSSLSTARHFHGRAVVFGDHAVRLAGWKSRNNFRLASCI